MGNLYAFGCSYTDVFDEDDSLAYEEYKKYRGGNFPKTWSEILSEKLNLDLINYGEGASGNEKIFHKFCKICDTLTKDDVVIIEWSYMNRFRWIDFNGNCWNNCSYSTKDYNLSLKTSEEIVAVRIHRLFLSTIDEYENIINTLSKLVGFELYYWAADYTILKHKIDNNNHYGLYLDLDFLKDKEDTIFREIAERGGVSIKEETNYEVFDHHLGEKAHQLLCDLFYEEILKKRNNVKDTE